MSPDRKKISFQNRSGQTLSAWLDMPLDGQPHHFVLFAHCFTCGKNLSAVRHISEALTQNGYAVLRFDFTGLGESEGDFADTNFSSNVDDLIDAAAFLEREYRAPGMLIGHSLGGAAVIFAAAKLPSVKAVVTIGAPADPLHISHLVQDSRKELEARGEATVSVGGKPFRIKSQFLHDLESNKMRSVLPELERAILIMHDPFDKIVGIDNARMLFEMAKHPKSFISLEGAGHLLPESADSLYVGKMISVWALRYLPQAEEPRLHTDLQVLTRIRKEKYLTEIRAGRHSCLADEPKEFGGRDAGPSPYDLLIAALGACTSMTLRMYADLKEWPLEEVRVHLKYDKVHAEECGKCEQKEGGKIDYIQREIEVIGALDEKQRQRLLEIANRCPVHKTLTRGVIEVHTELRG